MESSSLCNFLSEFSDLSPADEEEDKDSDVGFDDGLFDFFFDFFLDFFCFLEEGAVALFELSPMNSNSSSTDRLSCSLTR